MEITLTPGKKCKCSCRHYKGSDNKDYWLNKSKKILYSTDCHKANPKRADLKGNIFTIDGNPFKI